tara:strand:+ start:403 stop:906 length:504 start_codon:yes stop_codon:yes gene_type:complete
MIIKCVNCNKKFEVNSSLIPDKGRKIQCGSCNHIWFFTPNLKDESDKFSISKSSENNNNFEKLDIKETFVSTDNKVKELFKEDLKSKIKPTDTYSNKTNTNDKKNVFSFGKLLSYLIVLIISFVALIIILDTFKSPLSNYFTNLEIFLYNIFETITDIYLFLRNLLI